MSICLRERTAKNEMIMGKEGLITNPNETAIVQWTFYQRDTRVILNPLVFLKKTSSSLSLSLPPPLTPEVKRKQTTTKTVTQVTLTSHTLNCIESELNSSDTTKHTTGFQTVKVKRCSICTTRKIAIYHIIPLVKRF